MFALADSNPSAPSSPLPWHRPLRPLFARAAGLMKVAAVAGGTMSAGGAGELAAATYEIVLDPVSDFFTGKVFPGTRGRFTVPDALVGKPQAGKIVPFAQLTLFEIRIDNNRFNLPGDRTAGPEAGVLLDINGQPSKLTGVGKPAVLFDMEPDPQFTPPHATLQFTDIGLSTGGEWRYDDFTGRGDYNHLLGGRYKIVRQSGCGDERDKIIAEYKTTYPTAKGPKKPSYVPTCNDFSTASLSQKVTKYYTFGELSLGDRKCAKYSYRWAIVAPPLKAPAAKGYGLDRLIDLISVGSPTILHPKVNSGYRNPKRNFSTEAGCASSAAADSAHMYGSAIDLATPGRNNAERKKYAAKWNEIAKMGAQARFVENKPGYGCSTPRWSCVHADWQNAIFGAIGPSQPIIPLKAQMKIRQMIAGGIVVLATGLATEAMGAERQLSEATQQLAGSGNWQDRAKAFETLQLDLSGSMDLDPLRNALRAEAAGKRKVSRQEQLVLRQLLEAEIAYQDNPPDGMIDEDESEYFLKLVDAIGMYGDKTTIPLLFEEGVIMTGALAYSAAARTGDEGVDVLAAKMQDQSRETYTDYIGVTCWMLRYGTVREPENRRKVEALLMKATATEDDLDRSFAATCLKWLPHDKALPVLTRMASSDLSLRVREMAREALRTFGTSQ